MARKLFVAAAIVLLVTTNSFAEQRNKTFKQQIAAVRADISGRQSVEHARADIRRDQARLRRHLANGDEDRAARVERDLKRDYEKLRRAQAAAKSKKP